MTDKKMPPDDSGGVFLFVEGGVHIVDVFLVHLLTGQLQALAEALEMHHFPGPQELDDVVDVRIIAEPQDVVVGGAGLLLCCEVTGAEIRTARRFLQQLCK